MALIDIDDFYTYSYQPKARYGYDLPPHKRLTELFKSRTAEFAALVTSLAAFAGDLGSVPVQAISGDPALPNWDNGWLPTFDAIAIFTQIARLKPKRYIEIGSGNSTKFAALAKTLYSPTTGIVSIDPQPRAEIDRLCDLVVRHPLQNIPEEFFDKLEPGDMLFMDGSHRTLQNSDVTAFYLDILPRIKPGVVIGQHDIVLPWDYPADWSGRMYSEQYMLAATLLAAPERYEISLPCFYLSQLSKEVLEPFTNQAWVSEKKLELFGSSFWMTKIF